MAADKFEKLYCRVAIAIIAGLLLWGEGGGKGVTSLIFSIHVRGSPALVADWHYTHEDLACQATPEA